MAQRREPRGRQFLHGIEGVLGRDAELDVRLPVRVSRQSWSRAPPAPVKCIPPPVEDLLEDIGEEEEAVR